MAYSAGPVSVPSDAYIVRQFTLTIEAPTGSGIVVPDAGEHTYVEGMQVMLVAMPAQGYVFTGWEGGPVEDSETSTTQITMDADKTVKAVFKQEVSLTLISTGGGTTIPPPGIISCIKGDTVNIKAIPYDGYEINKWSGELSGTSDTQNLTMDADKIVGIYFALKAEVNATARMLYYATDTEKMYWNIEGFWTFMATLRHSLMKELDGDHHLQYLNEKRHADATKHELGTVVPHDDHVNLENIGTNTHDQIDDHIDNVDNPHSVTAAQVGAMALGTGLRLLTGTALPTASAAYRGQFFTVNGSDGPPPVEDKVYYCRSTDGGTTFEWKEISLI